MAVRSIVISGDPVLHSTALPVTISAIICMNSCRTCSRRWMPRPASVWRRRRWGSAPALHPTNYPFGWGTKRPPWRGGRSTRKLWITRSRRRSRRGRGRRGLACPNRASAPAVAFPLRDHCARWTRAEALRDSRPDWLARISSTSTTTSDGTLYVIASSTSIAKIAAKVTRKRGWGVPGLSWMPGVDTRKTDPGRPDRGRPGRPGDGSASARGHPRARSTPVDAVWKRQATGRWP